MEMKRATDISDGSAVDAGDDDGSVAANAEAEALVGQLAQVGLTRRVPLVLGREQAERTQPPEQVHHRMLSKIRLSERQLELGRRCSFRPTKQGKHISLKLGTHSLNDTDVEPRDHRTLSLPLLHSPSSSYSFKKPLPSTPLKLASPTALLHIEYRNPGRLAIIYS